MNALEKLAQESGRPSGGIMDALLSKRNESQLPLFIPPFLAAVGATHGAEEPARGRSRAATSLATAIGALTGGLGGHAIGSFVGGNRQIAGILGTALGGTGGIYGARALLAKDKEPELAEEEASSESLSKTTSGDDMPTKLAADVSDFRLAFPEATGREADFVEGFLKRAHEICGHSIEGTPDLPQALLSIAIAEKLASTPSFLDGFTKGLENYGGSEKAGGFLDDVVGKARQASELAGAQVTKVTAGLSELQDPKLQLALKNTFTDGALNAVGSIRGHVDAGKNRRNAMIAAPVGAAAGAGLNALRIAVGNIRRRKRGEQEKSVAGGALLGGVVGGGLGAGGVYALPQLELMNAKRQQRAANAAGG